MTDSEVETSTFHTTRGLHAFGISDVCLAIDVLAVLEIPLSGDKMLFLRIFFPFGIKFINGTQKVT